MERFEVEAIELIVAAGQVNHQHRRVVRLGEQHFADGGQILNAANIGDEAAAPPAAGQKPARQCAAPGGRCRQ